MTRLASILSAPTFSSRAPCETSRHRGRAKRMPRVGQRASRGGAAIENNRRSMSSRSRSDFGGLLRLKTLKIPTPFRNPRVSAGSRGSHSRPSHRAGPDASNRRRCRSELHCVLKTGLKRRIKIMTCVRGLLQF
jgi:hypothetical protein